MADQPKKNESGKKEIGTRQLPWRIALQQRIANASITDKAFYFILMTAALLIIGDALINMGRWWSERDRNFFNPNAEIASNGDHGSWFDGFYRNIGDVTAVEDESRALVVDLSEQCPGNAETFVLEVGEHTVINPHSCQLRWKLRTGCVRALSVDGKVLAERVCAGGDEAHVPDGLYAVVALEEPTQLRRTECDPRSTGSLLDHCI